MLVNLSASIFAEHINDHLATKGLPELPELARVQGLGDRLAGLLKDENFVSLNLAGDLARGDHWYSLSLLFICDYLHKGPGFTPAFGQDFIAAPSYEVLGSWSAELLNLGTMSAEDVLAITTQLASAVAANTFKGVAGKKAQIPNMMTLKPLVFQTSFKEGVQQAKNMRSNHGFQRHPNQASLDDDTIDGLKDAALHEFESISSTGIAIWTSTIKNQWIKAVSTRAMQSSQSARKITKYEMVPFSTLGTTIPVEVSSPAHEHLERDAFPVFIGVLSCSMNTLLDTNLRFSIGRPPRRQEKSLLIGWSANVSIRVAACFRSRELTKFDYS